MAARGLVSVTACRKIGSASVALVLTLALAGCTTAQNSAPPPTTMAVATPNVTIITSDLVGAWGLASFRTEADRPRTEAEARSACSNPYNVAAGPGGGAMMYLADQSEATEVFVKTASSGQVFIGPQGPPGIEQDRVVVAFENNNILIADWLNASARERYGTMIFVRCGTA